MSYVVILEGKRLEVRLEGKRTLAEIVSDAEYARLEAGELAAFTADDKGLMSLDSPLQDGATVILRPLTRGDLAGWLIPTASTEAATPR